MRTDKKEATIRAVIVMVCAVMMILVILIYVSIYMMMSTNRNEESSNTSGEAGFILAIPEESSELAEVTTDLTTTHNIEETLCVDVEMSTVTSTYTTESETTTVAPTTTAGTTAASTAMSLTTVTTIATTSATTHVSNYTQTETSVYTLGNHYTEQDIIDIAKVLYRECGCLPSDTEKACVAWTVLNRVDEDNATIYKTVRKPNQFAFRESSPVTDALYALAKDVLDRWSAEKDGATDVGRVLPREYLWFYGDGRHNYFRNAFSGNYKIWDYSMPSPYET